MRRAVELSNVHDIVLVFQNGGLVVIDIQVVGSREDGDDRREVGFTALVHFVSEILSFVSTNDGEKVISSQKGAYSGVTSNY